MFRPAHVAGRGTRSATPTTTATCDPVGVTTPLWSRSATWLARAIAAREVSSLEVVDACLGRIEAVNPRINAVVRLAADARDRARAADEALAHGERHRAAPRRPVHDQGLAGHGRRRHDRRHRSAGATASRPRRDGRRAAARRRRDPVGKTNTPEFTWSNETDNDVYGRTSNPYDLDRTPGGSSGGSASIVAAGGSPFDIGSDSGNSIRQPAHLCGVAGIKPTSGRVPRTGHWPGPGGLFESFTQLGPIARRVEDLELVLPIIAGPDGEDPHVVPVAARRPGDGRRRRPARRLVRRQRHPDADARDARGRGTRAVARDRGDRGAPSRSTCRPTSSTRGRPGRP